MPDQAPPGPVPVREATSPKSYLVVGPKPVEGVMRGGVVVLELTRAQENWLIEAGHIELAPEPAAEKAPVDEPAAEPVEAETDESDEAVGRIEPAPAE